MITKSHQQYCRELHKFPKTVIVHVVCRSSFITFTLKLAVLYFVMFQLFKYVAILIGTEESPKLQSRRRKELLEAQTISDAIPISSLLKLEELNPPDIMPSGNVGTPTSVFNELIRECRLPPKVVTRLGIVFPKSRSNKRYGNVPLQYCGEVLPGREEGKLVLTASGHAIYNTDDDKGSFASRTRKQMRMTKHWQSKKEQSGSKRDCDESWPEEEKEVRGYFSSPFKLSSILLINTYKNPFPASLNNYFKACQI